MIALVLPVLGVLHMFIMAETIQAEPWRLRADSGQPRLAAEAMVAAHAEVVETLRQGGTVAAVRSRSHYYPGSASAHCADATRALSVYSTNGLGHAATLHRETRMRMASRSLAGFTADGGGHGGDSPTVRTPGCALHAPTVWIESTWR